MERGVSFAGRAGKARCWVEGERRPGSATACPRVTTSLHPVWRLRTPGLDTTSTSVQMRTRALCVGTFRTPYMAVASLWCGSPGATKVSTGDARMRTFVVRRADYRSRGFSSLARGRAAGLHALPIDRISVNASRRQRSNGSQNSPRRATARTGTPICFLCVSNKLHLPATMFRAGKFCGPVRTVDPVDSRPTEVPLDFHHSPPMRSRSQ
ncbi:hypothetical protein SAMN04490220_4473 [Rhodococcus jostii]|uniref:Uncharacterized protein n=1 Tax=Rhodococcus jostii TaxID=132919 RepID=A0A1H5AL56_RHOJO|nr:hypothetical protein SAMN04490220_4473 [Rhodococcus jostii]